MIILNENGSMKMKIDFDSLSVVEPVLIFYEIVPVLDYRNNNKILILTHCKSNVVSCKL